MATLPTIKFHDPRLQAFYNALQARGSGGSGGNSPGAYGGVPVPNLSHLTEQNSAIATLAPLAKQLSNNADPNSLNELNHINSLLKQYGGTPVEAGKSHHQGLFHRFLDVISRPSYAVMNALTEFGTTATAHTKGNTPTPGGFWAGVKALPGGFEQGITGKKKMTGAELIQRAADVDKAHRAGLNAQQQLGAAYGSAHVNPYAKGIGGLGLDLALDPLTYTGLGIAKTGLKAPETVKAVQTSRDLVQGLTKGSNMDPKLQEILSGAKVVGKSPAAASKGLRELQPLIDAMGPQKAAKLTENYLKTASVPINKQLAFRVGATKFAIPKTSALVKGVQGLPNADNLVGKGMDKFLTHMQNAHKVFPELHMAGSSAMGGLKGLQLISHTLVKNLGGLKKDQRATLLRDFLEGNHLDATHALHGPYHYMRNHIENLNNNILGKLEPDNALIPREINKFMPKDKQFKRSYVTARNSSGHIILNKAKRPKKILDPEWVMNSIKSWGETDPSKVIWATHQAYTKAHAIKALGHEFRDFGVPLDSRTGRQLMSKGDHTGAQWVGSRHIPDTVFHPDVAYGIDHMMRHLTDFGSVTKFGRTVQRLTQPMKVALTKYSPGFHERNFMSDMVIAGINGVLPSDLKKAGSIIVHRGKNYENIDHPLHLIPGDPVQNAISKFSDVKDARLKNPGLRMPDGSIPEYIPGSALYAAGNKHAIFQTFATHEVPHSVKDRGLARRSWGKVSDRVDRFSDTRESVTRQARFIKEIRTNPTKAKTFDEAAAHAAAQTRKWHVDYSDLTRFERNVMRNVFPFYTWTRKNIPLMIETLFAKPGAISAYPKTMRAMAEVSGYDNQNQLFPSGQDAIVPQWMRDAGYVPVGPHNNKKGGWFGMLPNPTTDIINQNFAPMGEGSQGFKQLLSPVNPLFKIPYELMSGKQLFTGMPTHTKKSPLWQYFAKQLPAGNVAINTSKGQYGSLASFLTGIYSQQNTPNRQTGEIIQEIIKANQLKKEARLKYIKKHHLPANYRL